MKVFVTGASGFVGGACARRLRERGDEVLAMSRSTSSDERIQALGVTPVRCELGQVAAELLQGCDAVVHSAAWVEAWGTYQQFFETNVLGTGQLLDAARRAGVKRFIHIGTEAALFRGQHLRDIDETYPYPKSTPYYYSRTKAEAERRVLNANDAQASFDTLSLRPRMIWGPGDQTLLPGALAMIRQGTFAWVNGGRAITATTHIDNLCQGIELALARGRGGEAYFLTDGEPMSLREFLTRLVATQGIDVPERSVPGWVLRPIALVCETLWRLAGSKNPPPITRFVAALMSRDCTICIDKARRELGYEPVIDVAAGLLQLSEARHEH